jgi:hypothetical protein
MKIETCLVEIETIDKQQTTTDTTNGLEINRWN